MRLADHGLALTGAREFRLAVDVVDAEKAEDRDHGDPDEHQNHPQDHTQVLAPAVLPQERPGVFLLVPRDFFIGGEFLTFEHHRLLQYRLRECPGRCRLLAEFRL